MKIRMLCGAAALLALYPSIGLAQVAPSVMVAPAPPAVLAPIAPPAGNAVLRIGTEVPFRLLEEITTKGKKLRVGNRARMETSEPIVVNGVTVIPAGTPAVAEITDVKNKACGANPASSPRGCST